MRYLNKSLMVSQGQVGKVLWRHLKHSSALVRFLEEFRGRQSALGAQGVVVLIGEAAHLLESPDDQADRCKLRAAVGDLVLIQGEGLQHIHL